MRSGKCLVAIVILLGWSLAFSDVFSGTVTDSITNAPIVQVKINNSSGDSTYTATNGTFTLSVTTNVVHLMNVIRRPKNKVIQIRNVRGESISQFSSAMPNLSILANGVYIVTEKADNQAPFSYKILALSTSSISNFFTRNNQENNYSAALSKTGSIAATNNLTFAKNGYQTIQRTVIGSQSGMVVRMLIVAPSSAPVPVSPANTATNVSTIPMLVWSTVSGATTYRVQLSTVSTFANLVLNDSTVSGGNKTVSTALSNNTIYFWRANAKNSGGTSSWSTTWSFTTALTDADGNIYTTVKIGTQTWTVENLKTTKYNDGTAIPLVTNDTVWSVLTTPGYCWYNNDAATNKNTYGALYNWYTVNTGKLAPAGWHVPSDAEWDTLQNYLIANGYNYDGTITDNKIAKSMAAQTNWSTSTVIGVIGNNLSTNNRSGFSALPGGEHNSGSGGVFGQIGSYGRWWTATEFNGTGGTAGGYYRYLYFNYNNLVPNYTNKSFGISVRLVKN